MSQLGTLIRCPHCRSEDLEFVQDGNQTNSLCKACMRCWHVDLGHVHRVPPSTCPGCEHQDACRQAWAAERAT